MSLLNADSCLLMMFVYYTMSLTVGVNSMLFDALMMFAYCTMSLTVGVNSMLFDARLP